MGEGWLARIRNLARRTRAPRPAVGKTPADVVHVENKWRLLRYHARPEGLAYRIPILLVPSLINRHYVLDLMEGKSFVEWLVAQGHDVWIVDWGTPRDEDRWLTFDDIVDRYLGRAVRRVARVSPTGRAHVLGYCLGGTMTVIHAAARPEAIETLTTLAAPVAFEDAGLLTTWTRTPSFDLDALVAATGNVPWQLMQSAFHLLRPTLNLSKAVHVLDRAWDDRFLDGFLALETWGNDNVSFPGVAYREMIAGLYRENQLVRGGFRLSGTPARLENLKMPLLTVTFEHDNIVPKESATPLHEAAGATDKEWIHLPGGHVGAVVSRGAARGLWPRLHDWWARHDG